MRKRAIIILGFLCIISGYTYAQKVETGIITEKKIISVTGNDSGNIYLKAKTEILSTLSTGMVINISGLLTNLEITTGNLDTKKQILQNIVNIMMEKVTETGGKQNGTISKEDMDNIIMPNVCKITISYDIPSETCTNWNNNRNTGLEDTTNKIPLIFTPIAMLLIIGVIWYRLIKRSTKTQGYIAFSGLTILLIFIFMGLDYSDINFGGIFSFVGGIIGGIALIFVGLVIFFTYKANVIAKEKILNENSENEKNKKITELIEDARKAVAENTYEKAINFMEEAIKIEKDSSNYDEKKYALLIEYKEGLLRNRKKIEGGILKTNKADKESFIVAGESLFNLGKQDEAIKTYKEAIELFKDDKRFYAILGEHLIRLGRQEEAIEILNKAIEIDKEFKEAYFDKGIALIELGKQEDALAIYNKIITIDKSYTAAYINAQAILTKLGRYEEALSISDKAIENNIKDLEIYQNKGIILSRLKRYEEALDSHNKALEISPLNEEIFINKSATLIKVGKYEEALECINFILTKINPVCVGAYYCKACIYSQMNKTQEAVENIAKAIQMDKKYKEMIKEEEYFDNIRNVDEFKKISGE